MSEPHFNYFDTDHAIKEHQFIIDESGGFPGLKDRGLLDSVLSHIKNDDYYPELLDKMTHLVFGINKNHVFHDGNKRASIALSCFFLELNGHDFAVWLASSLIDQNLLLPISSKKQKIPHSN
jgi:death-on-curing protein